MIQIATSPLPSQEFRCVLDNQYCVIALYHRGGRLYMDLTSGDDAVCRGAICQCGGDVVLNVRPVFDGSLHFYDFEGGDPPKWEGLNDRWVLLFLSKDEALPGWAAY